MSDVIDLSDQVAVEKIKVLRGGQCSADPRLDRLREVDVRSLGYLVSSVLSADEYRKPRSYTWRVDAHLDQGSEGACVGFGWAHELIARPAEVADVTYGFAREQIYWEAQKIDQWPGGAYPGAVPRGEGTSVLAGAKVVQKLGYMGEYRWALSISDLVTAVGYKGPAVIGVDWYDGMRRPDANGFIKPTGPVVGGHCVAVIGTRVAKDASGAADFLRSYFIIHNSWGSDWGLDGRCRLTFADMMQLWPGGDFCVPMKRSRQPEPAQADD